MSPEAHRKGGPVIPTHTWGPNATLSSPPLSTTRMHKLIDIFHTDLKKKNHLMSIKMRQAEEKSELSDFQILDSSCNIFILPGESRR